MFALGASGSYRHLVGQARKWVAFGVATAAFALYALLAPPSAFWLDSGELSAAGAGLGIPHPTGFPLYAVLARLASLAPIGEIAFRISLLSALCAAFAVYLAVRVVLLIDDGLAGLVGAVAAGAVLAVSLLWMRQATVAEVYAPTGALLALTVLLLVKVGAGADARIGLLLAVVAGLGLAAHSSYRLLVFAPVAVVLVLRLRHGAKWPLLAPVLTFATAAGLHAYLPVRSQASDGALDWGHPSTLGALIDHARAKSILQSFEGEMFTTDPGRVSKAASLFATTVADSLGPLSLLLVVIGLMWLPRRGRLGAWLVGTLGSWIAIDAIYSVWINPMGLVDLQNGTPLVLAAAIMAGAGTIGLSRFVGPLGPILSAATASIAVIIAALHSVPAVAAGRSADTPSTWAEAILEQAPPRAAILVTNDSTAASLLYATTIMGARPDAVVLVRQLMADGVRTESLWSAAHPGQPVPTTLPALLAAVPAALWEPGGDRAPRAQVLVPAAPLFEVRAAGDRQDPPLPRIELALGRLRRIFAGTDSGDALARHFQAQALTQLVSQPLGARPSKPLLAAADRVLDAALRIDPELAKAWINRGTVASMRGDLEAAVTYTERAVQLAPNHGVARTNLARFYLALKKPAPADRHARRAMRLLPDNASAWAVAAAAARALGQEKRARQLADRARELDPKNRDVRALDGRP